MSNFQTGDKPDEAMNMNYETTNVLLRHIIEGIDELAVEIKQRDATIGNLHAKLFYDHLIPRYKQLVEIERQIEIYIQCHPPNPEGEWAIKPDIDLTVWENLLKKLRPSQFKAIYLQSKLNEIFVSTKSSSPIEMHHNFSHPPEQLMLEYSSHIKHQDFLIKRLESTKIPDNPSVVETEILYHQLMTLGNLFFSNHLKIESMTDEAKLENQQKIATEFHRKLIEAQTKLKKIISEVSKESTKKEISTPQFRFPIKLKLPSMLENLMMKSESLMKEITLMESTRGMGVEEAKIRKQNLTFLLNSFTQNQSEIIQLVEGKTRDYQDELTKKITHRATELQIKLNEIIAAGDKIPQTVQTDNTKIVHTEARVKYLPQEVFIGRQRQAQIEAHTKEAFLRLQAQAKTNLEKLEQQSKDRTDQDEIRSNAIQHTVVQTDTRNNPGTSIGRPGESQVDLVLKDDQFEYRPRSVPQINPPEGITAKKLRIKASTNQDSDKVIHPWANPESDDFATKLHILSDLSAKFNDLFVTLEPKLKSTSGTIGVILDKCSGISNDIQSKVNFLQSKLHAMELDEFRDTTELQH